MRLFKKIFNIMPTHQIASALRVLSIDAIAKANSGHPGMPLGMADIAAVLWYHFLKFNPENPHWCNRDRFILSNGHGCMLHYALLHLFGFKLSMEDIKNFRQLNSKTPGHPEKNHTPGIEVTTGPLSQGLACGIGMALAEKMLAQKFNRANCPELVDHFTYVFLGDGCLMEGLSHESCSFAGEFHLNKLIAFYDCNGITIDGPTPSSIKHETIGRFTAYNWHVIEIDGHNHEAIFNAIKLCQRQDKPSLIICNTIIGLGSIHAGQAKVHGSPLDSADIAQIKQQLNWNLPPFTLSEEIYALTNKQTKLMFENDWIKTSMLYYEKHPELYTEFMRRMNSDLPDEWETIKHQLFDYCRHINKPQATRVSSQQCLEILIPALPELLGGSADLTPSNNTKCTSSISVDTDGNGNYIHYGVREFGMMAMMNGISAHQGFIPYGGTFLVFSDYARNAIRLSSMMSLKNIFILTHDSIALGEDGPTHQPIEHLAMLRYTPNLHVWRPASPKEMATAWINAIEYQGTSCLILSRQNIPLIEHDKTEMEQIEKGAYILTESNSNPDIILIATGSEVSLAIDVANLLNQENIETRIVSMPCPEIFLQQTPEYQESVLPKQNRCRVAIEAACKEYWYQFIGLDGLIIGVSEFGRSAPEAAVKQELGFERNTILNQCLQLLNSKRLMPIH
jgi:transketolase